MEDSRSLAIRLKDAGNNDIGIKDNDHRLRLFRTALISDSMSESVNLSNPDSMDFFCISSNAMRARLRRIARRVFVRFSSVTPESRAMGLPLEVMTTSSSLILFQISLGLVLRSLTEMNCMLNLLCYLSINKLTNCLTVVNQK